MFYPRRLNIELTNFCTCKCQHCYNKCSNNGKNFLSRKVLSRIVQELAGKVPFVTLLGGEPLAHPDVIHILEQFSDHFKVSLSTNGVLIDQKIARAIADNYVDTQVSLYGSTEKTHDEFTQTPGSWHRACRGILGLTKRDAHVMIGVTLVRSNLDAIQEMVALAYNLGAKGIKFGLCKPVGRATHALVLSRSELDYVRGIIRSEKAKWGALIEIGGPASLEVEGTERKPKCYAGVTEVVLSPHGQLRPCEFLPTTIFSYADVSKQSLSEVFATPFEWPYLKGVNTKSIAYICRSLSERYGQ